MDLYARVNILGGRAVRLRRGDVANAISLDADPVERANGWVAKGASILHVVDLDAAAYGDYQNRPIVHQLVAEVPVPVQVAGGIRSPREVDALLDGGAWRVVMGTAAIVDQVMVWELCRRYPGQIVVSLDINDNEELATRGWTQNSGRFLEEALIEMSSAGAAAITIAEVGRDPLEEPPNLDALKRALSIVDDPIISAGGVRNLDDLRDLIELEVDGKSLAGVIVGREVTAGRFTLEDAARLAGAPAPLSRAWTTDELAAMLSSYDTTDEGRQTVEGFLGFLAAEPEA